MTHPGVSSLELSDPRTWPGGGPEVELVETHISWIALTGERAFKVKKPVDLGFLDFSTLERRRAFCEEEVRLNRRLAPRMYDGVVPLYRTSSGELRAGPDGATPEQVPAPVVDWAVAMQRLPSDRMLERLLERGAVDNALLERLARLLVGFHARAATGPGVDEHGSPAAVARNARENVEALARDVSEDLERGGLLGPALHAFLSARLERDLASLAPVLARRVSQGRIRDGHGDLHAGNICVLQDELVIYDCIEFAARFRSGDVACDLAFLTMDLALRGFHAFGSFLAHRYSELAADGELPRLVRFYEGYRALVRAKVAAITARDPERCAEDRQGKRVEAMRHVHLAAGFALPPALVLFSGLPATGKSTLARNLALRWNAELHSSDVRRKILAGIPLRQHVTPGTDQGMYAPAVKRRTYDSLLRDVAPALEEERPLVVDAAFTLREERRPFIDTARRLGRPVLVVRVEAEEATVNARLHHRSEDPDAVSDADLSVHTAMRARFEPPDELPPEWVMRVRTDRSPMEVCLAQVFERLALY